MTVEELRAWLTAERRDDQWWVLRKGAVLSNPKTLSEIEVLIKYEKGIQVLHVSDHQSDGAAWISLNEAAESKISPSAIPNPPGASLPTSNSMPNPPLTLPDQKQSEAIAWYYNLNGQRKGPATSSMISSMIASGTIDNQTLVWQKDYDSWIPLGQTELRKESAVPPPLTGDSINNSIVWVVAFAPIIGLFIEAFLSGALETDISNLWWCTLLLNVGLCYLDEAKLKGAGHDTKEFGQAAAFVPVYLYKRFKTLKQGPGYFITWIICFLLIL